MPFTPRNTLILLFCSEMIDGYFNDARSSVASMAFNVGNVEYEFINARMMKDDAKTIPDA